MITVMKMVASTPVAVLATYLGDSLFFNGQYSVQAVRLLRSIGSGFGFYF
jgi:hypothetical protein